MSRQFQYDDKKAVAAVFYLASKKEAVTSFDKFKAAKLLFLADKYHVVRYSRPILGDQYCAIEHGPIPSDTLNFLDALVEPTKARFVNAETLRSFAEVIEVDRQFYYPRFYPKGQVDCSVLSASDVEALDHIIEHYGKKSFGELRALTHSMPAYEKPWCGKQAGTKRADMTYEDFFLDDSDALAGALEEMQENLEIAKALSE